MNVVRAGIVFFSMVAPAASVADDRIDAMAGRALFERTWVPAPSSTDASDGLGPLFNARSCASCHAGGGGAHVVTEPDGTQRMHGAVVRLGTRDGSSDPYYGVQLQTDAVPGLTPEADVRFRPQLTISLKGPPLAAGTATGVRVAPSLWGSAELDRIAEAEILRHEDPDDANGDGISGRANRLKSGAIGRYGWKAAHATLADQIAHAFAIDLGLSSLRQPLPYGDCTRAQDACLNAPNGESVISDGHEISKSVLDLVGQYLASLKRPDRSTRGDGSAQFEAVGCALCHVPELKARDGGAVTAYSDLLLHDMGQELDDSVGEAGVASREWRTAPLRNSYPGAVVRRYLHDGSAASIEEAVAKHGGEAARSRQAFFALSAAEKARLTDFVNGLD